MRVPKLLSLCAVLPAVILLGEAPGGLPATRVHAGSDRPGPSWATPRFRTRPVTPSAALTVCPVGCPYSTIQAALDVAKPGDGVFVGNGVYREVLTLKASVSIRGVDPTATVIDGGGSGPVISVPLGVGATISGFTITGGRAVSGAGIFNQGALFLSDTVLSGNETTDPKAGYGGGLFNYGGSATLSDVRIAGNKAELGGGLLNAYGIASLVRCTIEGNSAAQFGGGIFNGATARLSVDTLYLKDNDVGTGRGGGIYSAGFTYVQRSTFSGNSSGENGGAVYQFGDVTVLTNSTLSGNRADFGGSAVYVNSGAMLITNATFANNSGGFGALFSLAPAETEFDRVRLRNTLMADNPGGSCFGTIVSEGYNIDSGNSCSFTGLKDRINLNPRIQPLADNGGSLPTHDLRPDSPAIDGGDPAGCTSPDDTLLTTDQRGRIRPVDGNRDGEAVCDVGALEYSADVLAPTPLPPTPVALPGAAQVCASGCAFSSIQAAIDAAAPGSSIAVRSGTYKERLKVGKNLTIVGAGSLYTVVDGESQGPILEVAPGVKLELGSATLTRGGGVINLGDLKLERATLSYHSGPDAGSILNRGKLEVRSVEFLSNVSLSRGGGIHNDGGQVHVEDSRFLENTSAVDGGAIYSKGGSFSLRDSLLSGNLGRYGGALNSRESQTSISASQFRGNRAELGGALFAYGGAVTVDGGSLEGNRADVGGAAYLYATDAVPGRSLVLKGTRLAENTASGTYGFGGAITNNGGDLTLEGVQLADNVARTGGGLYAYQASSKVLASQVRVEGNGATRGAGFFVDGGTVSIDRSQFNQNASSGDGGGLYLSRSQVALEGVSLASNSAARDGGGIWLGAMADGGHGLVAKGIQAQGNGAERQGGGLAVAEGGRATLDDATLSANESNGSEGQGGLGGAMVVMDGGEATLRTSLLSGNIASSGGALAISGTLQAENCSFHGNQALLGGAIYDSGTGRLRSCTLAANEVVAVEGETGGASGIETTRGGQVDLGGSIIAEGKGGPGCRGGGVRSAGYNLADDASCGLGASGDSQDEDAGLQPLADNGGPTLTLGLLPGSPAVDRGDPAGCRGLSGSPLAGDQRSRPRPQDGNGDGQSRCDIGAFERDDPSKPTAPPGKGFRIHMPALRKGE